MIVAGIGCRRVCPPDDIVAAVRAAERKAGCRATMLAAPAFKRIDAAAATLGLPITEVSDIAMAAAQSRCVTFSALAKAATSFASVAEAAALAVAGEAGRLLQPRVTCGAATCALAEGALA